MGSAKQAGRLMQFSTPALGKDDLVIESLEGAEGISRLFEFQVELLADKSTTIEPKSLIGSKAAVAIALNDVRGTRWVNGIIASFEQSPGDVWFNVYHARIVPAMWQLTLSSNCRVFQNKTVLDIAKAVFGEYGLTISDKTAGTYENLEYCTQYAESDFHFVSRILEESGIFYWFEHSDQDNKICLGDDRTAYQDCPLSAEFKYALNTKGAEGSYGAWIAELTSTATMISGKHSTADYEYRSYKRQDTGDNNSSSDYGKNAFQQYLYPAGEEGYLKVEDTESITKHQALFLETRKKASDSLAEIYRGTANARSLCAGYTFTLTNNPRDPWNQKYLLTSVTHHASQVPSYRSAENIGNPYTATFTAIASDVTFKPSPTFTKPKIYGPQTALVVAPSGDEMHIDKLGRVNVQFFWDKKRADNTVDNTWVRVAQQWAGNGWGTFFWPRLNDEVIIQFLNGDPDNPVVVGSVYNGVNVPKYALPDHSTRSGLVTRSSKGGAAANANELRFEDKMGSEQIFLNAEMDMDHRIEKDSRRYVGGKDSIIVKGAQLEQFGGDHNVNVKGASIEKITGNSDIDIGGNLTEKVGGNISEKVGGNLAEKIGMNYSMDSGINVYIKAGLGVVIESGLELTLKGAGGFINIGPAGVAISGMMVMINSGGAAGAGSPGTITDPQAPTDPDEADDGSKGGKNN